MDPDHRGRHTTVSFGCDVCGKQRRGRGTPIMARISYYETEHVGDICFMCEHDIDGSQRRRLLEAEAEDYYRLFGRQP